MRFHRACQCGHSIESNSRWQRATIRPDGGLIWSNGCGTIGGWNLREVSNRQSIGTARCLDSSPTPASPAPPASARSDKGLA